MVHPELAVLGLWQMPYWPWPKGWHVLTQISGAAAELELVNTLKVFNPNHQKHEAIYFTGYFVYAQHHLPFIITAVSM